MGMLRSTVERGEWVAAVDISMPMEEIYGLPTFGGTTLPEIIMEVEHGPLDNHFLNMQLVIDSGLP